MTLMNHEHGRPRWRELIDRHLLGELSDDESRELETLLANHQEARFDFRLACNLDAGLRHAALMPAETSSSEVETASVQSNMARVWHSSHRITAAVLAGVILGSCCTAMAWAMTSPKLVATVKPVATLANGGFESHLGRMPQGFPQAAGRWSGDEAEVVEQLESATAEGRRALRFVNPQADVATPGGRAISCDLFQVVDLRPLRATHSAAGESVLELSAEFLDARPANTQPSITFFCQLYLFSGDSAVLHKVWPETNSEALATGTAHITTLGGDGSQWRKLTARCLVPVSADFAVVQIAARPNLRPADLIDLFADNVTLTLKTQPDLPVRREN